MSTIIVGVDESQGSSDAIALASSLTGVIGGKLMLVNVFPLSEPPSPALNPDFAGYLRQDSEELLERLRTAHGDETMDVRSIPNPSPARGLYELAETEDADLIVVGSTHVARAGRVLPGSTAERLLHGSPCPVALAPKGYAPRPGHEPAVIGCGYDGSLSAERALEAAQRFAAVTRARLRVIRVFEPLAREIPSGGVALGWIGSYNDTLRERAADEFTAAVERIETEPGTEAQFAVGDPVQILAQASEQLDLLLVGSRGYGPMHAVMVGGVSGQLVREAACPVIVFPRTDVHAEEDSLFATVASRHD